jgi:hypothetical protein
MKIPGINLKNYQAVMNKVKNLREFFEMSEEQLTELFENSKTAKTVFDFFNKKLANSDENIDDFDDQKDTKKKSVFKKTKSFNTKS